MAITRGCSNPSDVHVAGMGLSMSTVEPVSSFNTLNDIFRSDLLFTIVFLRRKYMYNPHAIAPVPNNLSAVNCP